MTAAESKRMLIGLLKKAVDLGVSDIFLIAGFPVAFKLAGAILPQSEKRLIPEETEALVFTSFPARAPRKNTGPAGTMIFPFPCPAWGAFGFRRICSAIPLPP